MRAFVVLGFVFLYQAKRLAWGTSSKWPILCWVGLKTLTQSTNWYSLLMSQHSALRYWLADNLKLLLSKVRNIMDSDDEVMVMMIIKSLWFIEYGEVRQRRDSSYSNVFLWLLIGAFSPYFDLQVWRSEPVVIQHFCFHRMFLPLRICTRESNYNK